ncbi:MAG: hypothetical protein NT128_04110 [Proteobacteria bacterium]|nr:hypothetical protein [Pseudomonadota bacterium]
MMNFNDAIFLYQHEVELFCLYKEGDEHIKNPKIRNALQNFLEIHSEHIETLSKLLNWPQEKELMPCIRKSYLHNYKVLKNINSEEDALKAIQTGELLTIKAYQNVSRKNVDDEDSANIFTKHIKDNEKPYEYTNSQLRNRR